MDLQIKVEANQKNRSAYKRKIVKKYYKLSNQA